MSTTRFIINKNQKGIITFFANYIKTKKTENVPTGNFRSKYYNVEESTRESVKDLIIKLMNESRKGYG